MRRATRRRRCIDWHWSPGLHWQAWSAGHGGHSWIHRCSSVKRIWRWPPPWKRRWFITEPINQHVWPPLHTAHSPNCFPRRPSYPLCGNCQILQQQIHSWYTSQSHPGPGDGLLYVSHQLKSSTSKDVVFFFTVLDMNTNTQSCRDTETWTFWRFSLPHTRNYTLKKHHLHFDSLQQENISLSSAGTQLRQQNDHWFRM